MAYTGQIRKDDFGTLFRGTIYDQDSTIVDISTATTLQLILLKPNGDSLTKTATFTTDGTDGKLQYYTVDGDLSVCGIWKLQWYIVMPAGEWRTNIKTFKVYDNLT